MAINTNQANSTLNGLLRGSAQSAPSGPTAGYTPSGTRIGKSEPDQDSMVSWYLENKQANHFKFYTVMIGERGHCFFAWGRIGTAGQCKVQKFNSFKDAEVAALKQVYAKASKGYELKQEGVKFAVGQQATDNAATEGDVRVLDGYRRKAAQDPEFVNQQQAAARHYDDFIATAEAFMNKASTQPVETLFDDWQALQESWAELDDRHSTAATTVQLAGQMIQAALLN